VWLLRVESAVSLIGDDRLLTVYEAVGQSASANGN
jgi:hypothetical protein